MDHWFASDEISKGLYGETACLTIRDRYTKYLDGIGVFDKSTQHVVDFLTNLRRPTESYDYFWTDGARELTLACKQLKAAHDSTQPGNKRQNAVAERSNAILQDGARTLLMTAGLPPPYWVYAIRYFALCHNTQKRGEDETPWKARFGEEFDSPLILFGSAV